MKKLLICSFLSLVHPIFSEEVPMPNFLKPENPMLRTSVSMVSTEAIKSEEIQSIIDQMLQIAKGERADIEKRVMVGLAAPQIGIPLRIILVDIGVDSDRKNLGRLNAYINPQIIWYSEEKEEGREACYSVDSRIAGIVSRPKHIKIRAFDRHGNLVEEDFSGFTARIFQHEVDHLEGMRFPDRIGEEGILQWVEEDEYPEYRKNWQNWPQRCRWNTWIEMRDGRF